MGVLVIFFVLMPLNAQINPDKKVEPKEETKKEPQTRPNGSKDVKKYDLKIVYTKGMTFERNYKMKMKDGKIRFFSTFDTQETVMMGVIAKVVYEEKDNPNKPEFPYLNITSIVKAESYEADAFEGQIPVMPAGTSEAQSVDLLGGVAPAAAPAAAPVALPPNEGEAAIITNLKQLQLSGKVVDEGSFITTMMAHAMISKERAQELWPVFQNR